MADDATSINNPGIILFLDEANGSFRMASSEGGCWVERSPVTLNDLPVPLERKAHLHILRCRSAKDERF
jgi:hypothetical protein